MYPNLRAEMARKNITTEAIAEALDIDPRTARKKLSGESQFTIVECQKVNDTFFPDCDLDYLFEQKQ